MKKFLIAIALGSTLLGGTAFAAQDRMQGGMMQRADADGDGKISRSEFIAQAEQRFQRLDKNGDGKLSADERGWRHGKAGRAPGGAMAADGKTDATVTKAEFLAQAANRFAELDANHDGAISADEMKAMMTRMREGRGGPGMTRPGTKADAMGGHAGRMARIDTNHDGRISRDEMRAQADAHFTKLDTNRDGFIDQAEMKASRQRMGHHKGRMDGHRHHRPAPGETPPATDAPGSDANR